MEDIAPALGDSRMRKQFRLPLATLFFFFSSWELQHADASESL